MHGNDILLEKRPGSGIWGGLWCPPQFDDTAAAMNWCAQRRIGSASGEIKLSGEALPPLTHTFTHFKLHITPIQMRILRKPQQAGQPGEVWLDADEALQGAIPTPVRKILAGLINAEKKPDTLAA